MMRGTELLLGYFLVKVMVCDAEGEPGQTIDDYIIPGFNDSIEAEIGVTETPHVEDKCRGYYDVMGQWDPPFVCRTGSYLYCCGTCGFRFCCAFKSSRLDQTTCKNYDTPPWMMTGRPPPKVDVALESAKDKTNLIVYVICGVVAIMALIGIFTKLGLEKTQRPHRENMSRALAHVIRHPASEHTDDAGLSQHYENIQTRLTANSFPGMQITALMVVWILGTSLVFPQSDTAATEKVAEDPIPCSKVCTCQYDDFISELNMYCSSRNFTQVPTDMPPSTYSLWLDGNRFTSLPAAAFRDLTNLDFLNLQNGQLTTVDPQAFKGLGSLAHIHLERNRLRVLPGTVFQNTPNLASLSLHNNQLSRIEERLFAGLSQIWLLNLGWNSLTVLPETAFHDLQGLRELILAGNRLAYLQPQLFQNLGELKELDLTGNYLKVIKANVFLKLTKLQKLYLAQNQILTVVPRAFAGMKSLRWLDLTNNKVTSLHDDTFLGLHNLHVLRLSHNSITGIRPRTFRDLQYLEELRLSYNRIRTLGDRIFEDLGHLEVLELEHNQVQEAHVGAFTGLSHVAVINLSGSCFRTLPDQMFKGLPRLHSLHLDRGCLTKITTQAFSGLSGLRRLFLQHNNISVVEHQSFVDMVGLSGLDLSFNKLGALTTHTFSGLKNLEYLLLSNNECRQFLQNGTRQILPRLRYLDLRANALTSLVPDFSDNIEKLLLSGNRWKCDCSTLPLRNYALRKSQVIPRLVETHAEGEEPDTTITIYNNITCTSPPRLAGQDLRDVDGEHFQNC
uniref:Insulin like growth factor binding protein acid labile subunit n=1 Tax=Oreochromis niloticus TaxID=8128 RepID=A0A669B182_ORENI